MLLTAAPMSPAADIPKGTDYSTLNQGSAEQQYRHRTFHAYLPLGEVSKRNKISNYSSIENATGIFFSQGEEVILTLSGAAGQDIRLIVHDFGNNGSRETYDLHDGVNKITLRNRGLGYIDYRSATPDSAPEVHVDIQGGQINGVFTRHDDAQTWKRLLAEAKCDILDMVGERCHLTYDVDTLSKSCPERGSELLAMYDEIIRMEQEDIMGWHLDNAHPGNHIHGRVMWNGFMHADGLGAAFHVGTMPGLTEPDRLRQSSWGVAHEFGHVNQTRPGMRWVGMSEVTNNIYSAWVNYKLYPQRLRLEHEVVDNIEGDWMIGGRFDCYINNALVHRRLWQFHGGSHPKEQPATPPPPSDDPFVGLCPLWQLQLYMAIARNNPNFYPSIFRDVRATDESGMTNGELRILFFKRACDAAKLDLSAFFAKLGMLSSMDRLLDDYGKAHITVTREMALEALDYAKRYPKPDTDVLYYITGNSVEIYRDKLNIKQPEEGTEAPPIVNGRMEMPAQLWENAVAFEAYQGDKLLRISLRGLNHKDNCSTTVICPIGTDTVKAVQWDGTRYTVLRPEEK